MDDAVFGIDIDVAKGGIPFGAFGGPSGPSEPDIVIDSLNVTPNITLGGGLDISTTIGDNSTVAAGPCDIKIYLSPHSTFDASAQYFAEFPVPYLAGNSSSNWGESALLPTWITTPGTYYAIIYANQGQTLDESNYDNDSYSQSFTVSNVDTTPPSITVDNSMTVEAGATVTVSSSFLLATDPDNNLPTDLLYTIDSQPLNGLLLKGGETTFEFTQADINAGLITYEETNTTASADSFSFTVKDPDNNATSGSFNFVVQNSSHVLAGIITSAVTLTDAWTNSSIVSLDAAPGAPVGQAILSNAGSLTILAGGGIESDGHTGDTFLNLTSGVLSIDAPATFESLPTFYNAGSMIVDPGNGGTVLITSFLDYPGESFTNTGDVSIRSGTLDVFQGGSSGASGFHVGSGATALFRGGYNHPFVFTGSTYSVAGDTEVGNASYQEGDLTFASGTTVDLSSQWDVWGSLDISAADLIGSPTDLNLNGGRINLGGHDLAFYSPNWSQNALIQTSGLLTVFGNATFNLTLDGGGTLRNFGNVTNLELQGTSISQQYENLDNEGTITGGALVDIGAFENGNNATLENVELYANTVSNSGLMDLSFGHITGYVSNSGTIHIQSGTAYFDGGGSTNASDLYVASGAGGVLSGAWTFNGGTLDASGTFSNGGTWVFDGSASIDAPVVNNGTIDVSQGTLTVSSDLGSTGTLSAESGAILHLTTGGALAPSITGAGRLELTGAYTLGPEMPTIGTLQVDAGGTLTGFGTLVSTLVDDGTVKAIGGKLSLQGGITGTGAIAAGLGSVLRITSGGSFGGRISGGGTVDINAKTTLTAGASISIKKLVDTSRIVLDSDTNLTNAAGHTFAMVSAAGKTSSLSGALRDTLTNLGMLSHVGAGTADMNVAIINSGHISVGSGKLAFLRAVTNNGTVNTGRGVLSSKGMIVGSGTLDIGSGGTLTLHHGAGAGQTVDFLAKAGSLNLSVPLDFKSTIAGFGAGDAVDLIKTAETGFSFSHGTLTVTNGASTVANLHFDGSYTRSSFHLASDGHGGTMITHV